MSDLTLNVGGYAFEGWESVRVRYGLEQLASAFSVGYTQPLSTENRIRVRGGTECTVDLDGERVITGYIDAPQRSYDATQRQASISGRSRTADLIDCTAAYNTGQWNRATILQIARDLCAPFGISASLGVGASAGAVFRRFALQESETVFEAIDRACRMRGLLQLTSERGNLDLSTPGAYNTSTVLRYGANILRGEYTESFEDRYSDYTVKAQAAGDDEFFGTPARSLKRTSQDEGVSRHRPLTIMAENEDSGRELQGRVDWECNIRAVRSKVVRYSVQGWRDDDGALWRPNTLVSVDDDELEIWAEMLISEVGFQKSNQGTTTDLTLVDRQAYVPQPYAAPRPRESESLF